MIQDPASTPAELSAARLHDPIEWQRRVADARERRERLMAKRDRPTGAAGVAATSILRSAWLHDRRARMAAAFAAGIALGIAGALPFRGDEPEPERIALAPVPGSPTTSAVLADLPPGPAPEAPSPRLVALSATSQADLAPVRLVLPGRQAAQPPDWRTASGRAPEPAAAGGIALPPARPAGATDDVTADIAAPDDTPAEDEPAPAPGDGAALASDTPPPDASATPADSPGGAIDADHLRALVQAAQGGR